MQVVINQTQIEKAILDFMHKRINIREGSELLIEMKATRGAEGFSAVIDIIDNAESHAEMVEKEKERQKKEKEEKLEKAGNFLKSATKKAAAKPAEEPEPEEETPTEDVAEADTDAGAEEEKSEEEVPAPRPKKAASIFNKTVKS